MLRHFLWDYFKESGDLEAYIMYKELEYSGYDPFIDYDRTEPDDIKR